MTAAPALVGAAEAALGVPVVGARAVAGGALNDAWRLELDDGRAVFVKTAADAPAGGYAAEAAGLRWLAEPAALATPEVLAVVDGAGARVRLLTLEWIEPGRLDRSGEEELGRGLAALHAAGAPAFGDFSRGRVAQPLRIGPLELPNGPATSWPDFYAEQRLLPLTRMAAERDTLPEGAAASIDRLCARLPELAGPPEPPARLHGDLWSGNVMADSAGRPYLIDPAAYGGHREVDLAMLRLFGGPSERCFSAYAEVVPLADGHAERVALWQLFPLLVHAFLFGGGYGDSVARIARRYVG
ncbi:MAG TPA: fructosamine kinase family protein [Thermoleophilaceae bacterium]|nr:fructosamine kinase family protein [Thermoleophilaceae bacterium]